MSYTLCDCCQRLVKSYQFADGKAICKDCFVLKLERENAELRDIIAGLQNRVRFLEHEMDCMNGDAEYGN